MDAQTRKAMFRAKLKESSHKRDKRIDSPLVRYNELDQPVCKICNVVIKSESLWPAHQTSRRHNEAVEEIKARAVRSTTINDSKVTQTKAANIEVQLSSSLPAQTRLASSLPSNFFDQPDAKRQNIGEVSEEKHASFTLRTSPPPNQRHNQAPRIGKSYCCPPEESCSLTCCSFTEISSTALEEEISNSAPPAKDLKKKTSETVPSVLSSKDLKGKISETVEKNGPSDVLDMKGKDDRNFSSVQPLPASNPTEKSVGNQAKGSLPEGFFDNKDADMRARGMEPVKHDIKDEWKEFQKTIQEDLQEVDYRLEEEEFDAAELREEMELVEQRAYVERVEMLKKKQQEISSAKASAQAKSPSYMGAESSDVSSDEDEDEDNYLIDWRAKRF